MSEWTDLIASPWPDPMHGPWILRFHLAEVDGRVACVGVDLRSFREDRDNRPVNRRAGLLPVTSTVWREVNVASEIREALADHEAVLAHAAYFAEEATDRAREVARARLDEYRATVEARRGGRPPISPEHLEEVVGVYSRALDAGQPPRAAVAEHFLVSPSTAAKWIARAREIGLLEATTPGRAGGVPRSQQRRGRRRPAKGDKR